MKRIILAGATGYLGQHLVKQLLNRGIPFKAIARSVSKLTDMGLAESQIIRAEVTKSETLTNQLRNADILISTVGITRQKDGLTYMDVDYQANVNLLEEATKSGIKKFVYVSAINGSQHRDLKIFEAKEKFVDVLKSSGLDYLILRPNGFFSDMNDFLEMAKSGKVYLFGKGEYKMNPIHGEDLAEFIIESLDVRNQELEVGGPDILTQNEIAEQALLANGKSYSIMHLPDAIRKFAIWCLRSFTSQKTMARMKFFLTMMGQDNIAPRYGIHRLSHCFDQQANHIVKE